MTHVTDKHGDFQFESCRWLFNVQVTACRAGAYYGVPTTVCTASFYVQFTETEKHYT